MQKLKYIKEPIYLKKHEALPFQENAFQAIKDLDYAGIFHEQGLGKTKIAIDLMLYWFEKKAVDTTLIVVKKSLINNWVKELKIHSFLKPKILTQDHKFNFFVLNSPARVILANYEVIRSEVERLKLFMRTREVALLLDESAKIKNPESNVTKALFELAPYSKKRIIMSGTPSANRPYDLWAQIWFLDNGKSLGDDFKEFKRAHDLSNSLYADLQAQKAFEASLVEIYDKISKFCVRENKASGVLSLPEKRLVNIKTEWESHQYELYQQIREEERALILRNGIPEEDIAEEVLKRLVRLIEIASNPKLVDESYSREPGKLAYLNDLVNDIANKNEKVIIWTNYIKNVDWLKEELDRYGSCKIHGKISIDIRNRTIEEFLNNPGCRVMIATPPSAKEGLTLTSANHVIFFDRSFSLDDYLQSQDRIHRISQKKTCYVYNLIMTDSIDEWIEVLLQSKELAAKLAQGDISLEYYKSKMSYGYGEIIRNILGIKEK